MYKLIIISLVVLSGVASAQAPAVEDVEKELQGAIDLLGKVQIEGKESGRLFTIFKKMQFTRNALGHLNVRIQELEKQVEACSVNEELEE